MKREKRVYFGWWIVVVSFCIMALQYAPSVTLAGLFVAPLQAEFGATRTAVTTMITIGVLASMVGSMFAGKLLAKVGIRKVMVPAMAIFSLCYFGNALAGSLTQLYLLAVLRGISGAMLSVIPISILINNWFGDTIRGKVMGIVMVGSGVGAICLNPVTGYLLHNYGWRVGYAFFGALTVILLPFIGIAFVLSPAQKGLTRIGDGGEAKADSAAGNGSGYLVREAVRLPVFWILVLSFACVSGISQTWNNIGASFLHSIGFDALRVASILSVASLGLTIGKVIMGAVFDKWGCRTGTTTGLSLLAVAYAFAIVSHWVSGMSMATAAVMGLGMAVVNVAMPLITGDLLGTREYGAMVGYMQMAMSFGASLIPLAMSTLFDRSGSFVPVCMVAIGLCAVTVLLFHGAYLKKGTSTVLEK